MTLDLFSASARGAYELQRSRGGVALPATHLDAAYNLARYLTRSEAEAEEVVLSAYARAISRSGRFRGGDRRVWLLTIIRNSCYDRMRKRGGSVLDTDSDEPVISGERENPDWERILPPAERTELVRKSLSELPTESREVLVLRELEQLSYREIANVVGVPVGNVISRLSRARQRLSASLSDYLERVEIDVAGVAVLQGE